MLADRAFGDPLARYEQLYTEYFRTFCSTALSPDEYKSADTLSTLVPYLKRQLTDLRRAILALPPEPDVTLLHNAMPVAPAANSLAPVLRVPGRLTGAPGPRTGQFARERGAR